MGQATAPFQIVEATIDSIHSAYKSGQLTCRQLVQTYIDRIEALGKAGPAINSRSPSARPRSPKRIVWTTPTRNASKVLN